MIIFIVSFAVIGLMALYSQNKKTTLWICCSIMFFLLTLRSDTLGPDLVNYKGGYQYISSLSFDEILSRLNLLTTADLQYPYSYESGFALLMWIVSKIGLSFHGFLTIYAAFIVYSVGKWFDTYSEDPVFSCLLFITSSSFIYAFGILRQTIAMCILLWGTKYIHKRSIIKFLCVLLMAFLFHRASILLLVLYFLCDISINQKIVYKFILYCIMFLVVSPYVYSGVVSRILKYFGKNGYVIGSLKMNNMIILMIFTLLFIAFSYKDKYYNIECNEQPNKIFLIAFFLSVPIEIMGMYNEVLSRAIHFVWIYLFLLLPNIIKKMNNYIICKIGVLAFAIMFQVYCLSSSILVPYRFYWE